jgi:cell fate regulator YaaT (PSP1 superfamily)
MPLVVGVRFKHGGKIYYFDPTGIDDLEVGDWAVVKTARGSEVGEVVLGPQDVGQTEITGKLKPVQRRATAADTLEKQRCHTRSQEALKRCREKVAEYGLPMKIVHAEYGFEGKRLLFFFSAEKRVDFRDLVKDLAKVFRTRIELRQIGVRDEARLVGGMGRCGRPLCCSAWLSDFSPVSIKMAKQQGLPLNPMEISGLCGRLLCCLAYEHDFYQETKAKLPKKGKKVQTAQGLGTVKAINILTESVTVELRDGVATEVTLQELEAAQQEDLHIGDKATATMTMDQSLERDGTLQSEVRAARPEKRTAQSGERRGTRRPRRRRAQKQSASKSRRRKGDRGTTEINDHT